MSGKLTNSQRLYLNAVLDWAAPYEIAETLGRSWALQRTRTTVRKMLGKLSSMGLIQFGAAQGTWRITPAGRSLLSSQGDEV